MKYCPCCNRNVMPKKKMDWLVFFFCVLTGFGLIAYIPYYLLKPKTKCPICGCTCH